MRTNELTPPIGGGGAANINALVSISMPNLKKLFNDELYSLRSRT
jgi:hypothetical protein